MASAAIGTHYHLRLDTAVYLAGATVSRRQRTLTSQLRGAGRGRGPSRPALRQHDRGAAAAGPTTQSSPPPRALQPRRGSAALPCTTRLCVRRECGQPGEEVPDRWRAVGSESWTSCSGFTPRRVTPPASARSSYRPATPLHRPIPTNHHAGARAPRPRARTRTHTH